MSISEYLESSPISDLVKYGRRDALDAFSFVGGLRKHPYDPEKCLLMTAEQEKPHWLDEGVIIEFRIADVLAADELPSPVNKEGAARSLVRLWVKRGAIALRYEPFEVSDSLLGPRESMALRARMSKFFQDRAEKR